MPDEAVLQRVLSTEKQAYWAAKTKNSIRRRQYGKLDGQRNDEQKKMYEQEKKGETYAKKRRKRLDNGKENFIKSIGRG